MLTHALAPNIFGRVSVKKILSIFAFVFLVLAGFTGTAQLSQYSFSVSNGTYQELTSPTATYSGANLTYQAFNNINIGFTFKYNGTDYTYLGISGPCANVQLGRDASAGSYLSMPDGVNVISPFYSGLRGRSASTVSYATTGIAPNRIFIVQYSHLGHLDPFGEDNTVIGDFNFQIKLYETSGKIEFVYGTITNGNPIFPLYVQVGLTGGANADYSMRKGATGWNNTTKATAITDNVTVSNSIYPEAGLTFTYSPSTPCTGMPDAGAASVSPVSGIVVPGRPATLSLSGYTTGTDGIAIQWQSSSLENGTYTDIEGATASAYMTPVALTPGISWYRAKVTCTASAMSSFSNSISVTSPLLQQPGHALFITGTKKGMQVPANGLFDISTGTFECWVKPTAFNGQNKFIGGVRVDPAGTRFSIHLGENVVGLWNNATFSTVTAPAPFITGKWYHIAMVIKANSSDVYVNGIYIGSTANGMGVLTGLPFRMGSTNATSETEVFNGAIDEVRIWNTQRTAEEINNNMYDTIAPATDGLVAYYRFDEGDESGASTDITTVYDATSHHLNGTLSGFGLEGDISGWKESYAMVVPKAKQPSEILAKTSIAEWQAPTRGIAENYLLDVSTDTLFTSFLPGLNAKDAGTATSFNITGLEPDSKYYYRVRANKASVTGEGSYSNVISFRTLTSALPVIFSELNAYRQNNSTVVSWKVEAEVNIDKYEVEKSVDGITFTRWAETTASGRSGVSATYTLLDADVKDGTTYYRIKAIENTGNILYSSVASVRFNDNKESSVNISPNPVRNRVINLKLVNLNKGGYIFGLYNANGVLLSTKVLQHSGGTAIQTIRLPALAKGAYLIKIEGGTKKIVQQFIYE